MKNQQNSNIFYHKYQKYKQKYLQLKKQLGGNNAIIFLNNENYELNDTNNNKKYYCHNTKIKKIESDNYNYYKCNRNQCNKLDSISDEKIYYCSNLSDNLACDIKFENENNIRIISINKKQYNELNESIFKINSSYNYYQDFNFYLILNKIE